MYLSEIPFLVSPIEGETLFINLAVTEAVVSSVICSLRNDKMMHVQYVSHVLAGAETQYNPLEKHIFNLVVSSRKLKSYFLAHSIIVLTNEPLKKSCINSISQGEWLNRSWS